MSANTENKRVSQRIEIDAKIEFFIDADIINATGIDVSQTGISFLSSKPLAVEMRLLIDGKQEDRRAHLLWARQGEDGLVRYGLEFVEEIQEEI